MLTTVTSERVQRIARDFFNDPSEKNFNAYFKCIKPILTQKSMGVLRDRDAAEDNAQNVMIKMWKSTAEGRYTYDDTKSHLSYLITTVENSAKQMKKFLGKFVHDSSEDGEDGESSNDFLEKATMNGGGSYCMNMRTEIDSYEFDIYIKAGKKDDVERMEIPQEDGSTAIKYYLKERKHVESDVDYYTMQTPADYEFKLLCNDEETQIERITRLIRDNFDGVERNILTDAMINRVDYIKVAAQYEIYSEGTEVFGKLFDINLQALEIGGEIQVDLDKVTGIDIQDSGQTKKVIKINKRKIDDFLVASSQCAQYIRDLFKYHSDDRIPDLTITRDQIKSLSVKKQNDNLIKIFIKVHGSDSIFNISTFSVYGIGKIKTRVHRASKIINSIIMADMNCEMTEDGMKLENCSVNKYYDRINTLKYRLKYSNGLLHGDCEHFYPGKLIEKTQLNQSDEYACGLLKKKISFVNGKMHGECKEYYEDGSIKSVKSYNMGEPDGYWREYDERGGVVKILEFENSILMWRKISKFSEKTGKYEVVTSKFHGEDEDEPVIEYCNSLEFDGQLILDRANA